MKGRRMHDFREDGIEMVFRWAAAVAQLMMHLGGSSSSPSSDERRHCIMYISSNIWYVEYIFQWGNYGNLALRNACELVKCIVHWRSPFENLWSAEMRSFEKVAKRAEVRSSSGNWQPIDKVVHPTSLPACLLFLHGFLMCIYLYILGPEPALGWLGQGRSSWGYSSHGYASHASLRAYGAQLGGNKKFR